MKKLLQSLNAIFFVATIIVNYISNTGVINNETMASVSAKYQNLFTPAGYAFSIWGLIYLGLLGFVIYYGHFLKSTEAKDAVILKIGWWFIVSCICNSLWVFAWLYHYIFLTIPIMVILFIALLKIILNTKEEEAKSTSATFMFLKLPFYIYAGWISVALVADIAAFLTKIQWNGFGISDTTWTVVMFVVAFLIHIYMIWKQKMPAFALVAVWALVAIAVANREINTIVFTAALTIAMIIFSNVIIYFFLKRKIAVQ